VGPPPSAPWSSVAQDDAWIHVFLRVCLHSAPNESTGTHAPWIDITVRSRYVLRSRSFLEANLTVSVAKIQPQTPLGPRPNVLRRSYGFLAHSYHS